jgi:hypothetical protein
MHLCALFRTSCSSPNILSASCVRLARARFTHGARSECEQSMRLCALSGALPGHPWHIHLPLLGEMHSAVHGGCMMAIECMFACGLC